MENDASSKVCGLLNGRRVVAWLAALGVLGAAGSAPAEPLTFRLSWVRGVGAEDCPNAEQLTAAVEVRLGRDAFSEPASRHIEGSVARAGEAWRVQLRVMGTDNAVLGSRELEANGLDCSSIADAASLAVALTIDPQALAERPERPSVAPPAPPPPEPSPPEPSPPAPSQPAPREVDLSSSSAPGRVPESSSPPLSPAGEVVPRGLFAVGILPDAGPGVELGTELRVGRWVGFSMSMAYLSEERTTADEFGLSLAAGSLGLCLRVHDRPRALLKVCGELMAGALQVVVYHPIPTRPGEHLWLAPRLGPRFAYRLRGWLSLEASALAVVPLVRERFSITGVETPVFQTASLSLLAGLGLRVSIP